MTHPTKWTSAQAAEHSTGATLLHYDEKPDLLKDASRSRMLIARWGHRSPLTIALYARDGEYLVELCDNEAEHSGGRGRSIRVFDDLTWATRYFAALHWEEDDAVANCAFRDPRCAQYVPQPSEDPGNAR